MGLCKQLLACQLLHFKLPPFRASPSLVAPGPQPAPLWGTWCASASLLHIPEDSLWWDFLQGIVGLQPHIGRSLPLLTQQALGRSKGQWACSMRSWYWALDLAPQLQSLPWDNRAGGRQPGLKLGAIPGPIAGPAAHWALLPHQLNLLCGHALKPTQSSLTLHGKYWSSRRPIPRHPRMFLPHTNSSPLSAKKENQWLAWD